METPTPYFPQQLFAATGPDDPTALRVFIAPQRYIQGQRVLSRVGRYLSLLPAKRVALLMSERGRRREGVALLEGLQVEGTGHVASNFNGECSLGEIDRHVAALAGERVDCVVAAGGGKCIDTGKAVAFRLGVPIVVVPTLASNDAPCSALSILYSPEGVSTGVEFYPNSPAIVVVDTEVVAAAPERYLVAGIGDAMATWYEARVCMLNEAAVTTVGSRPTIASAAIGEACARTLFEHGAAAAAAVAANTVDPALEATVEANTLLSGLGFESGGLAAAHGVAQSLTSIPRVHDNYLHGEHVAMGTLTQLMLEARPDEAVRVAEYFAGVGLPVHLGQLSIDVGDRAALDSIVEGTLAFPYIRNMPEPVTAEAVLASVLAASSLGLSAIEKVGDVAYRRLQSG